MKDEYYYVACDGGKMVNKEYRHYFRLYNKKQDQSPILVDQGLPNKIPLWEKEFSAILEYENPYPNLD
jgi:hypothetical protein